MQCVINDISGGVSGGSIASSLATALEPQSALKAAAASVYYLCDQSSPLSRYDSTAHSSLTNALRSVYSMSDRYHCNILSDYSKMLLIVYIEIPRS